MKHKKKHHKKEHKEHYESADPMYGESHEEREGHVKKGHKMPSKKLVKVAKKKLHHKKVSNEK